MSSTNPLEYYPMKLRHRGYCFIASLQYGDRRPPFQADLPQLIDDYRGTMQQLGFSDDMIEVQRDSNVTNIMNALREIAKKNHTECSCVAVVIICEYGFNLSPPMNIIPSTSSHAQADSSSNPLQDPLQLSEIFNLFTADKCPQLNGKPKLFFMHTPRDPPPPSYKHYHSTGHIRDWVARSRCPEVNLGWDYCIVYAPLPFASGELVPNPVSELTKALGSTGNQRTELSRLLVRFKAGVAATESNEVIMPKVFSSLTKLLVFA